MNRIKIILRNRVPTVKLIIDRFVTSLRMFLHHIDYSTDRLSASMMIWISGKMKNIENAVVNMGIRVPLGFHHFDYSIATLAARLTQKASMHGVDYASDAVSANLLQFSSVHHVDYDRSTMGAAAIYPVLLGTLATMTLGDMASKTLGELTFDEI